MMWKCKECGESNFIQMIECGSRRIDEIGECGEIIISKEKDEDIEFYLQCDECGNEGYSIEEIADWEDE